MFRRVVRVVRFWAIMREAVWREDLGGVVGWLARCGDCGGGEDWEGEEEGLVCCGGVGGW